MKYMRFETFLKLYGEAVESGSLDLFISERGWQEWMNDFKISEIIKISEEIYFMAHSSLSEIRKKYNFSRAGLSRKYYIPARTLQDWENGTRKAPAYVISMLYYTLLLDIINEVAENEIEK